MANLLNETLEDLAFIGKTPSDVRWVGSRDGSRATSWEAFAAIADFEYDEGFGGQEIASDLVVVGDGWWLERQEYDGSEAWALKSIPQRSFPSLGFRAVRGMGAWLTLKEIADEL